MGIFDFLGFGNKNPNTTPQTKESPDMSMFCYQCEQAANGGCSVVGVCGKQPDVAALQDLLVYSLKGLSHCALAGRKVNINDIEANRFICRSLFAT